jgi:hypothetical protein
LPIGALHGREAVADLELELFAGREANRKAIERRIEQCAMRHRIVSRRTSLVAIAEEPSVDPKEPRRRERLAVELPAGISAEGAGLMGGVVMALGYALSSDSVEAVLACQLAGPPDVSLSRAMSREDERDSEGPAAWIRFEHLDIRAAVIGREEDGTLIVEFEVPFDGFLLPWGDLMLGDGAHEIAVEVVAEKSSPQRRCPKGFLVRLALRPRQGSNWPAGRSVELRRRCEQHLPDGEEFTMDLTLHFDLPPAAEGPTRP